MKLRTWCIRSGQILANPVLVFAGFLVFLTIFNPATIQAEDGRGGITIRHDNVPIQKVFQSIEKQSGYRFFYNETLLQGAVKVTLNLQHVSLQEALDACFRNQPLSYAIVDKTIIVKRRPEQQPLAPVPTAVSFTAHGKGKIIAVRGKVTSNNVPVAGASIMIKGTDNGASTDKEGIFTLSEVDEDAILIVSSVSHQAREIKVNGQGFISIDLAKQADDLDEAVVVAYNTTTKRMNTGAVSVVKGAEIQSLPTRSIDRALQGMVPGLQVTTGSGLPGGGVSAILLRGIATGGYGISRNPLFIVDGTIITQDNFNGSTAITGTPNYTQPTNPLSQINPNDIESVSILKDAAAIALYGSQASNGVIIVTTKKGKAGKLLVNFRNQTDVSARAKVKRDVLNQDQYLDLLYESYKNANSTTWTDRTIFSDLKNKFPYQVQNGDTSFYPAPNWFNELYSKHAASVSNDVSFSGGSDKTTFYIGLGNLTQKGILKSTGFDRNSVRYNVNMRPVKWLNIGINSSVAYTHQNYDANGGVGVYEGVTGPNGFPYSVSPLLPVRDNAGNYILFYPNGAGGAKIPNPVARMDYDQIKADAFRGIGNVFAEVSFLKFFSFRTNLATDLLVSKDKRVTDKRVDQFSTATSAGNIYETDETRSIVTLTNLLRYQQSFANKHTVNVLLSQEAQTGKSSILRGEASGFSSGFSQNEISSANTRNAVGYLSKTTFLSYFTQGNYSYKNKYFVSAGVRLDGSSRFGASVPLNKFWSFGAGWVLSEESFLNHVSWMDYLKLRGSVGVAGNTIAIPTDARYNTVNGIYYSNTPTTIGTSVLLNPGNPNVKSESTLNTDLGLEARFWKERINVTADVYRRKTYDMVTSIPEPFLSGLATIYTNLGDMENKGIELSLSVDVIKNKTFGWNINGNWSRNTNKLVKAYSPETYAQKFINKVGENYNSWYLVRWAGVDPADGSPQWLDKDGKITKTFSNNNRVMVGKPQPDGFGGLNTTLRYKSFELGAFFYYTYGYKVYNSYLESMLNDGNSQPYANQSIQALNRWQKPGDEALNPKRVYNNTSRSNSTSTRYLVDGDYIRLRNVKLSYLLDEQLVKRLSLKSIKVFVQGNNLLLWTKSTDLDPDNTGVQGENAVAYPTQKTLSIGVNVDF